LLTCPFFPLLGLKHVVSRRSETRLRIFCKVRHLGNLVVVVVPLGDWGAQYLKHKVAAPCSGAIGWATCCQTVYGTRYWIVDDL
jgi:hypothetical protein